MSDEETAERTFPKHQRVVYRPWVSSGFYECLDCGSIGFRGGEIDRWPCVPAAERVGCGAHSIPFSPLCAACHEAAKR